MTREAGVERLLLIVAANEPATLERALSERAGELAQTARAAGAGLRLAVQLDGDPLAAGAGAGRSIVPAHGLVELSWADADGGSLNGAAEAVAAILGDTVDWPGSAVAVGPVHEVLPAACDDLLLVLAAQRLPTLDRAAFHDYWLHRHASLALSLLDDAGKTRMGYHQLHADAARSRAAAELMGAGAADADGVLEVSLSTLEDLPHLRVPGFAEAIMADEQHFADPVADMRGAFMRTLRGDPTNGGPTT